MKSLIRQLQTLSLRRTAQNPFPFIISPYCDAVSVVPGTLFLYKIKVISVALSVLRNEMNIL